MGHTYLCYCHDEVYTLILTIDHIGDTDLGVISAGTDKNAVRRQQSTQLNAVLNLRLTRGVSISHTHLSTSQYRI